MANAIHISDEADTLTTSTPTTSTPLGFLSQASDDVAETLGRKPVDITPTRQHGNPCVRGTRVPAYIVLDLFAEGLTVDEVAEEYDLDVEAVRDALVFTSRVLRLPAR